MASARKRLRPGLKIESLATCLRITDHFDVLDAIEIDEPAATILAHVLDGRDIAAIAKASRATTGEALTERDIKAFIRELADLGLFTNATTDATLAQAFSRHVLEDALIVPGLSAPTKLRLQARSAIEQARAAMQARFGATPPLCRLEGALSPHGPMWATGDCAAYAYALLTAETWPETFVIIGTSHYAQKPGMLTLDAQTPLGRIASDAVLTSALADSRPRFAANDPSFLIEHSWQQDLPLLQVLADEFARPLRVVALQTGRMTARQGKALGRLLRRLAFHQRKRICVIASGDLSHFGASYRWKPAWLDGVDTTAEVVARIRAYEAPILQAICDRDHEAFETGVATTSFCARAQVNALMEFVTTQGRQLHHRSVVNWVPVLQPTATPWTEADKLFNGASIAFAYGGLHDVSLGDAAATAEVSGAAPLRLCQAVFMEAGREVQVLHACDNAAYAFPLEAHAIMLALREGVADMAELQAALGSLDVPRDVLQGFVDELRATGLFHPYEAPGVAPSRFGLERAATAIAAARQHVPYYRKALASNRLLDASPITSVVVKQQWRDFLHEDADALVPPEERYVRSSSGSAGAEGLQTVESSAVFRENDLAGRLIVGAAGRTVSINRPSNLGFGAARSWPAVSKPKLTASPGFNPSNIALAVWDALIDQVRRLEPEALEGEGAYLAGFARRCRALGIKIPSLRRVLLGHSYPWQLYVDAISQGLGVPISYRYHSSEIGLMARTCARGAYHLVEAHYLYEVLDAGKWCRQDELGALVVTALDAKLRPLIRYAIGDLVRMVAAACPCGRPGRVIQYAGRMRHLFTGRKGALVTYEDLNAVIGAPMGLDFFHLDVGKASATLSLVPAGDRRLVDAAGLRDAVATLIDRKVKIRWCDHIELPQPKGKLLSLATRVDESATWARRFLG